MTSLPCGNVKCVDLIATLPMMTAGCLQDDTAGEDASETMLQLREILNNFLAQAINSQATYRVSLGNTGMTTPRSEGIAS
jgi:hypothetical protein